MTGRGSTEQARLTTRRQEIEAKLRSIDVENLSPDDLLYASDLQYLLAALVQAEEAEEALQNEVARARLEVGDEHRALVQAEERIELVIAALAAHDATQQDHESELIAEETIERIREAVRP